MSPSGAADAGGSDGDPALGHWWFLRSHQHINWRSARASSRTSLATTATRSAPLRHERDDLPSGDMSAALSASSLAPHARALRARSRRVASSPPRVRRSSRVATPSRASATAPPEEPPLPLFEGPECWRGPDLMRFPESWTHVLTSDEVAELDARSSCQQDHLASCWHAGKRETESHKQARPTCSKLQSTGYTGTHSRLLE